eukprot:765456-Hanusia_phi.AAC.6
MAAACPGGEPPDGPRSASLSHLRAGWRRATSEGRAAGGEGPPGRSDTDTVSRAQPVAAACQPRSPRADA